MRILVILTATLLLAIGWSAKEARAYTTSSLVQLCRGELPKNLELPEFVQKLYCKLYFDGYISGYYFGNNRGQISGALGKIGGNREELSEEQREFINSEGLENTELCMSAVQMDSIGELFSSFVRRNPNLGEEASISVLLFMMREFKC